MRKNLFLILTSLLISVVLISPNWICFAATEIYVAPNGSESNPGTLEQPTTLASAIARAVAGTIIYVRGGTYAYSTPITVERRNDGSATARKHIFAYDSEKPILDFSSQPYNKDNLSENIPGFQINGHYWHVKGLTVRDASDNGIFIGGNYNIIENCEIYGSKNSGLQISRYRSTASQSEWPSYNQVLNCYSHDNYDPDNGEDADGFTANLGVGPGNVFKNCIAAYNVADGWDLSTKSDSGPISPVILENCIAFRNGQTTVEASTTNSDGNGFKLGGEGVKVDHILRNCLAFENKKHGFTANTNSGSIEITNCTAWNNGTRNGSNFDFDSGTHNFINNLSFRAGSSDKINGTDVHPTNVWWKNSKSVNETGLVCSDTDFVSLAPAIGRDINGVPVIGNFLKLVSNSDLKNAGTPKGTDIGAVFTSGGVILYPVIYAQGMDFANNQTEISNSILNNMSSSTTVDFSLIGFAAGTTGGQGGTEITVTDGAALQNAIKNKGSQPLTIYVNGRITPSNAGVNKIDVKDVSDVSIIGVGSNGEFDGIGIKITRASNIIIQNLKIHHVATGDKDCISIEGPAHHIWVDHCELYNDLDHDKDYYDGLLDAKGESEYITYSWNYLHDSYKTCLVGSSDSDDYDRKITFHHNYFENCYSRLPLYRFGTGHLFNNYWIGIIDTGINSRMGAKLRIENNHFENAKDPIGFWYSSETGYWDVSNNKFVNCTGSMPTTSTCSFTPPYSYANYMHDVDDVKSIVMQYAGVGKLNGVTYPTPLLTPNTTASGASSVTVTITNWGNAPIRQYRIGSGSWQTYSSPVVITENCTIYAQGSDGTGNASAIGNLIISNIGNSGEEPVEPGNTLFSDNFESGSSAWTQDRGQWSVITDGSKVYYHSDLVEGRTFTGSSSWTNYRVEARVKVDNFNGSNRAYVCGRYRDGNNFYAASLSNGKIELRAKIGGSTSTLASKDLAISAGNWYTIKLEINGTTLNMYVDGVLQLTATHSGISSGGIGLVPYKVIAKYDDILVTSL